MEINGDNDEDELLPDEMSEEELLSVKERVKPIQLIMPCDVSTWWNSTYNMLQFATKYCSALDIMMANHDMNLCKFELSEKEWDSNWATVGNKSVPMYVRSYRWVLHIFFFVSF